MATYEQIERVRSMARQIRHDVVDMIGCGQGMVGHLGGSCSVAEVVSALYFYKMSISADRLSDPKRDRFLLSKGHAALAQYSALARMGVFPAEELKKVKTLGAMLQGHPDKNKTPGVEANTGSLGQGLSIGMGIALGQRLDGYGARTYVIMGDGELAEGQIWEAAMAAANFKLTNLIGILDRNLVQATSAVKQVMDSGEPADKFRAFGWNVIEINGHSAKAVMDALDKADEAKDGPTLILCNTVKGKFVSFAEGQAAFHNAGLTAEQFAQAHKDIDQYIDEE